MTEMTERKLRDTGLLVLRIGFGAIFIFAHGWGKMTAGPDLWTKIGGSMALLGVTFAPAFWGFMSAFAELAGGACIAAGIFFRPMCAILAFNMIVATTMHLHHGDGLGVASNAMTCGVVALSLVIIGPGNFALGKALWGKKS